MEKFCCSICSSSDVIQSECGHIQCDRCTMLPVSNVSKGRIFFFPFPIGRLSHKY